MTLFEEKKSLKLLFHFLASVFHKLLIRRIKNTPRAGCESQLKKRFRGMTKRGAHVKEENFSIFFVFT